MDLKYLKKLRPILNKVGKRHNIPVVEGEFIFDLFFKSFRDALTDPRVPKVKLPLFGTFYPKISYIYRSLRASIRFYKLGGVTREYINSRIERIWPIRNRLLKESQGEITWNRWRKKDMEKRIKQLEINEHEERERSKKQVYGGRDNPKKPPEVFGEIQRGLHKRNRRKGKPK